MNIHNNFGRKLPEPRKESGLNHAAETVDEMAVRHYECVMRPADADAITQSQMDAFLRLTPPQRDLMFDQLLKRILAGDADRFAVRDDGSSTAAALGWSPKLNPLKRMFGARRMSRSRTHPSYYYYLLAFAGYGFGFEMLAMPMDDT